MKTTIALLALAQFLCHSMHAAGRESARYVIAAETLDAGGGRAASPDYTQDLSLGGGVGISSAGASAGTMKYGYIAQLYEVIGLQIAASPATIDEGATRQLGAAHLLDDLTTLAVPTSSIAWSVQSGPLAGIDAAGLATAGIVYRDTADTAMGTYGAHAGILVLTVLDTNTDNYGTYAGDLLPDDWQVQYFGFDNPHARPGDNPDGDELNNLQEIGFGTDPALANFGEIIVSGGAITGLGGPTTMLTDVLNGVEFRALYGRRKDYLAAHLLYTAQFSADLATWVNSTAIPTVIADDGVIEAVTVPYPFFVNGRKARFFRVAVTLAP